MSDALVARRRSALVAVALCATLSLTAERSPAGGPPYRGRWLRRT